MTTYKLDKTAFKAQTAEETADHSIYYKNLSWKQRLQISDYLNSIAFNHPLNHPPRMDKTKFVARSRE